MSVSVTSAISMAIARTQTILFRPFNASKWFTLGFCAWLAYMGNSGGTTVNFNVGGGGRGGRGGRSELDPVFEWIGSHMPTVIMIGVGLFLLCAALTVLLTWLRARGQFMFLDGVVRNRGAVAEPWRQFRRQANSLFWVWLVLGLLGLGLLVITGGIGVLVALPDIRAEHFGAPAILGILVSALLLLIWSTILGIFQALLVDFVVPVMYQRNVLTMEAWHIFCHEVAKGLFWKFVLFYLMELVLSIAIGIIAVIATCLTCCIALLPYIGTVILLPVYVFLRCYSLSFMEQIGPEWRLFQDAPPGTPAYPPPAMAGMAPPPQ
ncbi:MAG: hypothetical protein JXL80_07955 [Planctomycetes bacterium]|nr:hypothetical protein [Planctomycetota bacterium]